MRLGVVLTGASDDRQESLDGSEAAQDGAARAALDAYARGVNAWIETVNSEARGRGAPELWRGATAVRAGVRGGPA